MKKTSGLKRLARTLLTTTCLTVAAGVAAHAGVVTEPGTGFGNVFPGTLLPSGTTQVNGTVTLNHGAFDFFEFQGLPGGATLASLSFQFLDLSPSFPIGVTLLDDLNNQVVAPNSVPALGTYNPSGNVPADGNLVVRLAPANEAGSNYTVNVTLPSGTPEPATLGVVGLGLAGLGALALRRRKQQS